ncbi:serine/threonine-protein kinase [Ornithinimicrobium cerasi]|uniref:non-specific serine/threonine protein kinase n=1 Tax=Ornithinimicrobium cerasi TaxID=2248773 RepID=A0A285VGW4_9MICO|nr:serine/threonine-protein kinase [Ornithinimicrobium cerasi]SOC51771.1 Serine/threonine protein kinase [Ornithinimicrobium cerasi]
MEELPAVPGYDVLARLGGGASSTVWRARRHADGLVVALKVLRPADGDVGAGLREAGLLARVRHPHVVHLYDVLPLPDPVTGRPAAVALATQLAGGGSLAQLLARRGMLSPGELVTVLQPVSSALADLHRAGVVHGDLSAGNVLFLRDGMPVIGDLGASRITGQPAADVVGTGAAEGMVAPEVTEGFAPTPESDVYQVGALGWLCLTGVVPGPGYAREALTEVATGLPPGLADLVEACLAPQPEDRPDAEEVAAALLATAFPEPVEVAPDADPGRGLTERLRQQAREASVAEGTSPPRRRWLASRSGSHRPEQVAGATRGRSGGGAGRGGRALVVGAAVLSALALVAVVAALLSPGLAIWPGRSVDALGRSSGEPAAPTVPAAGEVGPVTTEPEPAEAGPAAPGDTSAGTGEVGGMPEDGAVVADAGTGAPDAEEVRRTVQALVDGRGVAWEDADEAALASVMAPGSPALESEARQLERVRAEGLSYADVTFRVEDTTVVEAAPDRLVVAATVSRAPLTGRDASGERLVSSRTRTDSVEMVLTSVDGRWLLWSWGDAGAR